MKINNENEKINNMFPNKKISFGTMEPHISCFHMNILHIKSSRIPIMENKKNNISTYQETRNMIQDYFIKKNIFKYSLWSVKLATLYSTSLFF